MWKDIRHSALQQRTVQNRQYAGCCRRSRLDLCRGDILFIETILSESKGELKLTGNLGNVMKESASTAFTYLHANAKNTVRSGIIHKEKPHIHVPEGAVPKDGPSAGVTMLTSLASAYTGRRVKPYLAMTGEITLRGQVLPVGGIKKKYWPQNGPALKRSSFAGRTKKM